MPGHKPSVSPHGPRGTNSLLPPDAPLPYDASEQDNELLMLLWTPGLKGRDIATVRREARFVQGEGALGTVLERLQAAGLAKLTRTRVVPTEAGREQMRALRLR